MRNKKTKLILLVLIGFFMCSFSNIFIQDNSKNSDTILLKANDYDDESAGIPIVGTTENIFSICQGYEHSYLYFYNTSLGGSLYRIDLDNYLFTPTLIRGNLGTVHDIDTAYAPDGDMIFFATSENDNAIMKMNVSLLVYEKILSSTWTPQKLSVDYFYFSGFTRIDVAWITASNVFYWNDQDQVIENIETNFFNVIDVQCEGYDILYYNEEEIVYYDAWSLNPHEIVRIYGTGITSAFLDTSRNYIVYSQDDDYESDNQDGIIYQFDYDETSLTLIQTGIDYPVSVWCTGNYIYWLERGYWSSHSMIYRYSYYYGSEGHYYSKVSRAHGVMWADRIEFEDDYNQNQLGTYWGYDQLYIINSSDITPPDTIVWMGGTGCNKTIAYDHWWIDWWNSWDLNGIKEYELIMSEDEGFSTYDTYWIQESEISYTSLEFSDMDYGDYYYKIRAIDNIERVNENFPNIGRWSNTLHISYPAPEDGGDDGGFKISSYSILVLGLAIGLITIPLIIRLRKRTK